MPRLRARATPGESSKKCPCTRARSTTIGLVRGDRRERQVAGGLVAADRQVVERLKNVGLTDVFRPSLLGEPSGVALLLDQLARSAFGAYAEDDLADRVLSGELALSS
jgi:hypothetical protein